MDKALALKLFELQKRLKPIVKDSPSFFKDKSGKPRNYFDVNTLIAEIKPHLEELKLVILQPLTWMGAECKPAISTQIIDSETGEYIAETTMLPPSDDAQRAGGVITYYRRYALTSLLLIEGAEDDDSGGTDNKAPVRQPITPIISAYDSAVAAIAKIDRSDTIAVSALLEKIGTHPNLTKQQREELFQKAKK